MNRSALRNPGRVAVVEHEGVAVGIGEERHVADAGIEDVAGERDAALLELGARCRHVLDVERKMIARWARNDPIPMRSGSTMVRVTVPVSNSAKLRSGRYIERRRPSVVP